MRTYPRIPLLLMALALTAQAYAHGGGNPTKDSIREQLVGEWRGFRVLTSSFRNEDLIKKEATPLDELTVYFRPDGTLERHAHDPETGELHVEQSRWALTADGNGVILDAGSDYAVTFRLFEISPSELQLLFVGDTFVDQQVAYHDESRLQFRRD